MKIKSLAIAVIGLCGLAMPASAQPIFALDYELPWMILRICPSPESSREQAKLSEEFGRQPYSKEKMHTRAPKCLISMVKVVPRSPETGPFNTWAITYVSGSQKTFDAEDGDRTYTVPYDFTVQRARFYFADMTEEKGISFKAWVEIPDRPYMVDYFLRNPR
jgi:hypothetical protein